MTAGRPVLVAILSTVVVILNNFAFLAVSDNVAAHVIAVVAVVAFAADVLIHRLGAIAKPTYLFAVRALSRHGG